MPARAPQTPLLDEVEPAIHILAKSLGITQSKAREALRDLVKAGYVVGPREPTNAMLLAYITSYGQLPVNPATTITAIGKARRRWQAMADRATAMALSMRRVRDVPDLVTPAVETDRERTAASPQAAGGRARAERLSPERRHDIAKKAARTRWGAVGLDGTDEGEKA